MKTIDLTPSWTSVLHIYLAVLQNPEASFQARKEATEELENIAKLADEYVKIRKAQG